MNATTCPVCDWALDASAITVDLDGASARVCCPDCADKLKAEPAKYAKV